MAPFMRCIAPMVQDSTCSMVLNPNAESYPLPSSANEVQVNNNFKQKILTVKRKIINPEELVIKKRTIKSGRIRNLRTGEPVLVERELPPGERFDEHFISNFLIIDDGFCTPYREGRLPEEEINWLSQQDSTPKSNKQKKRVQMRRITQLSEQLDMLYDSSAYCSSTPAPSSPRRQG